MAMVQKQKLTKMPMLSVQTQAQICDQLFSKSDTVYAQSLSSK